MGVGVPCKPLLASGPSANMQLLQQNQVAASLTGQPLTLWWARGVLTGWLTPSIHWYKGVKPAFPPNSNYEVCFGPLNKGESVQWQLLAWRGVAPSPNQGTDLGASSPQ